MCKTYYRLIILIGSSLWVPASKSAQPQQPGSPVAHSALVSSDPIKHDLFFGIDKSPRGKLELAEQHSGDPALQEGASFNFNFMGQSATPEPPHASTVPPLPVVPIAPASPAPLPLPPLPRSVPQTISAAATYSFPGLPMPQPPERPKPAQRNSENRHPQDFFLSLGHIDPVVVAAPAQRDIKQAAERVSQSQTQRSPLEHTPQAVAALAMTKNDAEELPKFTLEAAPQSNPSNMAQSYAPIRREKRSRRKKEGEANRHPKNKSQEIACPHCDKKLQRGSLPAHIMRKHTKNFPYKCTYCNEGDVDRSRVARHFFKAHQGINCDTCKALRHDDDFASLTNNALRQHIRDAHASKTPQVPKPPSLALLLTAAAATPSIPPTSQSPVTARAEAQSQSAHSTAAMPQKTIEQIMEEVIAESQMDD